VQPAAISAKTDIQAFGFDILLRDKFPFQPPLVMTRTKFSTPSLADGRDLVVNLLPEGETEWKPSMKLYDLIMKLPDFISETIEKDESQSTK